MSIMLKYPHSLARPLTTDNCQLPLSLAGFETFSLITNEKILIQATDHRLLKRSTYCPTGPFSFKICYKMRLTASLVSEAKSRNVSAIFVYPLKRKTDMAVFRKAAIT